MTTLSFEFDRSPPVVVSSSNGDPFQFRIVVDNTSSEKISFSSLRVALVGSEVIAWQDPSSAAPLYSSREVADTHILVSEAGSVDPGRHTFAVSIPTAGLVASFACNGAADLG